MTARKKPVPAAAPVDDDLPPGASPPVAEPEPELVLPEPPAPEEGKALEPVDYARRSLVFEETASVLRELATKSANIKTITNKAGLQECRARRIALRDVRVAVEKRGKNARDGFLAMQRAVIGVEAELVGLISPEEKRLQALETDAIARQQAAIAAAQEKEAARQREISERFAYIRGLPLKAVNASVEAIDELLVLAEAFSSEGLPEDMAAAANYERQVALASLKASRDARVKYDADQAQLLKDQAELAELRAANAAALAKHREETLFLDAWTNAIAEDQSRRAAFDRLWEEAHAADRDRTQRLANEAEALRLREEAATLALQKRQQAAQQRQLAIDNATLREAATDALAVLERFLQGSRDNGDVPLVIAKLQAALAKDDEFAGFPVPTA